MLSTLHGAQGAMGMKRGQAAVATNGLKQNLVAHWSLYNMSAGGTFYDLHAGLSMFCGFKPGLQGYITSPYPSSREIPNSSGYAWYRDAASSVPFQTGDKDFTICGWVYPFYVNSTRVILAKAISTAIDQTEYALSHNEMYGTNRLLKFQYGQQNVIWGALTTWKKYLVIGWREKASNTINIQVNNGTVVSAYAPDIAPVLNCGTGLCKWGDNAWGNWNACMQAISIWISEPGAGGALSAAKRTALWNNGAGMRYDQYEP
jgi:hypothetical protein